MTSIPAIHLASGAALPAVGLGFWKIAKPAVADLVQQAARVGWRHFDCACDYGNEAEVGAGLAKALASGICRRTSCGSPRSFGIPITAASMSGRRWSGACAIWGSIISICT